MKSRWFVALGLVCLAAGSLVLDGCSPKGQTESSKADQNDGKKQEAAPVQGKDPHAGHDHAAGKGTEAETAGSLKPQERCPVMGGKINRDFHADYKGLRIYFCCGPCIEEFNLDPEKYVKVLADRGEKPEEAPAK